MSRRLWYRDSYGRWHEDRRAQGRVRFARGMGRDRAYGARRFVVIASMIH